MTSPEERELLHAIAWALAENLSAHAGARPFPNNARHHDRIMAAMRKCSGALSWSEDANSMDLEDQIAAIIKEIYAPAGHDDEGRSTEAAHEICKLEQIGAAPEMLTTLRLVAKRLGELNRADEAGMRLVLANAIANATRQS